LLVVGTERVEETSADHPAKKLLTELQRSERLTSIELGPLDAGETIRLASHVLSRELDGMAADLVSGPRHRSSWSEHARGPGNEVVPRASVPFPHAWRSSPRWPMSSSGSRLPSVVPSAEVLSLCSGARRGSPRPRPRRAVAAADRSRSRALVRLHHDKLRELCLRRARARASESSAPAGGAGARKRFASDLDPWASAIAIHYLRQSAVRLSLLRERGAMGPDALRAPGGGRHLTARGASFEVDRRSRARGVRSYRFWCLSPLRPGPPWLYGIRAGPGLPGRELSGRIARPTQNVAVPGARGSSTTCGPSWARPASSPRAPRSRLPRGRRRLSRDRCHFTLSRPSSISASSRAPPELR
jgi:hypothetical protein